ncbi:serine/threonine-protein kinase [Streptomyces physcomitrii]|uniref:non-specific serine/threonine protein kinase n=1 Tax=Streptomyces physcomitrii TaxID=2724184 RepID=A0ABX1H5R6_9ACTN|nr:serine/threonine-protein kinase [Streptomyces physcomitrii]NKI43707.1 serine/threonine protein kinase [Streptomyces physcomitrii]
MDTGEHQEAHGAGRLLAGRYRTVAQLGRGGMGVVWRAVDEVLGREVAVKELRTYTDTAGPELADMQLRMRREARAAARVRHPGVIAVHDVTQVEGRPLIVMELVDGPSLDDILRERGLLDPREAAALGADVLEALAAAHAVGVLHRDVKPGNILCDRSGRTVLTDFGIATMDDPGDGSTSRLTRSGEIVGSLDFLAPERAQGQQPGPASDLWAVGATLYAAVEGASPFRRTSTWSTLSAIVAEPLPVPRRAGALMPVLERLLHKDPRWRPGAEEAAAQLRAVAAGQTAPPPGPGAERPTTPNSPLSHGGYGYPPAAPPAAAFGPPAAGAAFGEAPAAHQAGAPGSWEQGAPATPYGPGQPPAGQPPRRDTRPQPRRGESKRRGPVLLVAVAVAVVLAVAATGLALMNGSDGTADEAGSGGASSGSAREPSAEGSRGAPGGEKKPRPRPEKGGDRPAASAKPDSPAGRSKAPKPKPKPKPPGRPGGEAAPVCHGIGGGKFNCQVWRTATSYTAAGAEAGILRAGTSYFFCQQNLGRRENAGKYTNIWSAKTDDDSGNTQVFVNVVNIKGGADDAPVPGLPYC